MYSLLWKYRISYTHQHILYEKFVKYKSQEW